MRSARGASVLMAAALLAGCNSLVTTQTSYDVTFRAGVPSEFAYAAGDARVMPVVVVGNPFALPKPEVDQRVVAAMQGNTFGVAVRYEAVPAEAARTGYAVVVLLDAAPGTSANLLCARRGDLPAQGGSGGAALLAAFCGDGDARSWAYSTTGPVTSPDDPLFRALVARTTAALLPPRDDDRGRGSYW